MRTFRLQRGGTEWTRTERTINRVADPTVTVTWSCKTRLTGRELELIEIFGDVYVKLDGKGQDHDPVVAYGWKRCYQRLESTYWDALEKNPCDERDPFFGEM